MKREIAKAMLKRPQELRLHQKAVFVFIAFVGAYFIGWLIVWMLSGRQYLLLAAAALPLLVVSSVVGKLLRSVVVPPKVAD